MGNVYIGFHNPLEGITKKNGVRIMKLGKQWFVLSDIHLGHANILKYGIRPADVDTLLAKNWNNSVQKFDNVLCLGDLTFMNKEKTKAYFDNLRGNKYLILGNHDGNSVSWYRDVGFTVVDPIYKRFKDKYDQYTTYLFTHEPVTDLPEDWFNVHGHIHNGTHREYDLTERHINTSLEAINYRPTRLWDLIK